MELWLDSANIDTLRSINELGLLNGVTTNPAILAKSMNDKETLNNLLKEFKGPLAVQVHGKTADLMEEEGKFLNDFSDRIIVKIPVTREGLKAIRSLSSQSIPVMATCIFTSEQALLAAKSGASYVALYLNRLEKNGGDAENLVESTVRILATYGYETKVIAASIKNLEQIELCLLFGVDAVTLSEEMFEKLLDDHPMTKESLDQFERAYKAKDASLSDSTPWV